MVAKLSIPFCTQVKRANSGFVNSAEGYLNFGSKIAYVIAVKKGSLLALIKENKQNFLKVTAKILTMILSLGLLPLAALTIKILSRASLKGRIGLIIHPSSTQLRKKSLKKYQKLLSGSTPSDPKLKNRIDLELLQTEKTIQICQKHTQELEKKCKDRPLSKKDKTTVHSTRHLYYDFVNEHSTTPINERASGVLYYRTKLYIKLLQTVIKSPLSEVIIEDLKPGFPTPF